MAAPVGSSLYGRPPEKAEDPATAKPYRAEKYVPPTEVTSLPVPIDVHIPDSEYPEEARRAGFEGAPRIFIVVDAEGRVVSARVLQDPGMGLGEAAVRSALKHFRFKPARRGDEAVVTEIPFTVRFELR
jgi:protein TonB